MVTQPTQYEFVDFASGDMSTADFDGRVMPLRQGLAQHVVRPEDVAFLLEAAKERCYAWNGAQYMTSAANYDTPAHLETFSQAETRAVPTQRVRSQQMYDICNALEDANWNSYNAQDYFGYLATPFEEHIDSSVSLSAARSSWIDSHFFSRNDLVDWHVFESLVAKSPVLSLFDNVRSMAKPVFSKGSTSLTWAMADISTSYLTYTPTEWTDTGGIAVSQPYLYAERNPYSGHEQEFRFVYPQTQGVLYYPRGSGVRGLVDMTNGSLWYFFGLDYNYTATAGYAMIQIPCTIVTGVRSYYVRVESSTFLQQFLRVGKGLGVITSSNRLADGVSMVVPNNFRAFFVADLTDHTKWWGNS